MRLWKTVLLIVLGSVAALLLIIQRNTIARLRLENQQSGLEPSFPVADPSPAHTTEYPAEQNQTEHHELLRLRNEVSQLRGSTRELLGQLKQTSNALTDLREAFVRASSESRRSQARTNALTVRNAELSVPRFGAWLGIAIQNASALADLTGVQNGVLLSEVIAGGPAERANLREGDVILKVDGQDIVGAADFKALLVKKLSGQTMLLDLMRGKELIQVEVTPCDWPQ